METTQQVVSEIYSLLRRPSQQKLHYKDVLASINTVLKRYIQEEQLGAREQRTQVTPVTPSATTTDYALTVDGVPDFEAVMLEYSPPGTIASNDTAWYEVKLITLQSWPQHYASRVVVACIYGSDAVPDGVKLKLNLTAEQVAEGAFRLTYRVPLLSILQMGDRPPLPSHFLPMVQYDAAVDCMSKIRDDSTEFVAWMNRTKPDYVARVVDWRGLWTEYLNETRESPVAPIVRHNAHRGRSNVQGTRGYLPRQ